MLYSKIIIALPVLFLSTSLCIFICELTTGPSVTEEDADKGSAEFEVTVNGTTVSSIILRS